ncbi:MAG TPA: hypothetical protein VJ226_08875 [Bradyrhizobium sp.]|nr:hypothetical protein [Bradyrhizobium sp.]
MTIKASGRSALILATGLFACVAASSQATATADNAAAGSKSESAATASVTSYKYARHGSRHGKVYAHRRSSHLALKFPGDRKADAADGAAGDSQGHAAIPPSVANANATMMPTDTLADSAKAMSARAGEVLQAAADNTAVAPPAGETLIVAADQLNDVDRALQEGQQPPAATADAPAEAAKPVAPVTVSRDDGSSWDQASLIGKIFIAFGGLLTVASAARMFMA